MVTAEEPSEMMEQVVRGGVEMALDSPWGDTIRETIEEESEPDTSTKLSGRLPGAVGVLVLVGVGYAMFRRFAAT